MQATADEECRRASDTAREPAVHVALNALRVKLIVELGREAIGVQAELRRVGDQVLAAEGAAGLVHAVVHLPERSLGGRRLGGLRGALSVGVDLPQRKM